jgi:hypothetical protein
MRPRPMMMRALASKAERSAVLALQRRRGRVTRTDSHLCINLSTENKEKLTSARIVYENKQVNMRIISGQEGRPFQTI